MRRKLRVIYSLVELASISSSSSSTSSDTDGSLNTLSEDDDIQTEYEDLLFFPLMQHLMTGTRKHRVENYLHLVDSWTHLEFKEHLRMSRQTAERLIDELEESRFLPQHSFGRQPISAKLSFFIFLWFMANTEPLRTISDRFDISISSVFRVVRRIVTWLLTKLDTVVKWPRGNELLEVSHGFYQQRNIPNIIGAIDCTHIRIEKPSNNAQEFFNRKKYCSINLQAVVDSARRFINIYTGEPGSLHDARVFRRSPLYNTASQEPGELFPNSTFIIGDSAYPSLPWLVPPFRDNGHLTLQQREFNFLHSSTRMAVERTFGLLKSRFRRLKFFSEYRDISFVTNLIAGGCILHNYCINVDDDFELENIDDQLDINNPQYHFNNFENNGIDRRMQLFRELFPE